MNLVDDPAEAKQIWREIRRRSQEIQRRRYAAYEELRKTRRTRRDWMKNRKLRGFRRGHTDLWDLTRIADVILDDGSYLDEVVCYNGRALGMNVGGWTGAVPEQRPNIPAWPFPSLPLGHLSEQDEIGGNSEKSYHLRSERPF